ncbi:MAG TPA: hypothetical protein V6C58_04265 [Allocoleopsis sp.]
MRARKLDIKELNKISLKQLYEIYSGKSLNHLALKNLKDIYNRISLESDLIREPYQENKYGYILVIERYFQLMSQVKSSGQLSLF